jgi:hypothetical protein
MGGKKEELMKTISKSAKDLHRDIDMHYCLIASALKEKVAHSDLQKVMNLSPPHSREAVLKRAIKEAIEVLEESRKAFKSKRLELLRKRLTQVLIDME